MPKKNTKFKVAENYINDPILDDDISRFSIESNRTSSFYKRVATITGIVMIVVIIFALVFFVFAEKITS